jgi:tellurite resistance protein
MHQNSPKKCGLPLLARMKRIVIEEQSMMNHFPSSITASHQEEDVMQGLVTAGAFVAIADGRVQSVERNELATCMRQLMLPISDDQISELFERSVRELKDRDALTVVTEKLRTLAGLSLASVVVRTAERVAAADRQIHPNELQAIRLIRLLMASLQLRK